MDLASVAIDALRAAIAPAAAAYALAALGLNLQFGNAGLLNLGHAGFMAIGAYGLATTVTVFGGGFWLGLLVGIVGAAIFAVLLGLPTVRLRADYLAITTIAAAEILRFVLRSGWAQPWTGGVYGLQRFAQGFYDLNPFPASSNYAIGPVVVDARALWLMTVSWVLVFAVAALLLLLLRSPWGRVLSAVRLDEDLARSLGKNVFAYKLQALVIGGVLGGLAGMLLAMDQQNVNPDNYTSVVTFFVYTIVIIGGAGRAFAPIVGAVVFWVVISATDSLLRQAVDSGAITWSWFGPQQVGVARFVLVGLALMLIVVFRPRGVFARRREAGA
jgi:neutral amino acid transport system permease protein